MIDTVEICTEVLARLSEMGYERKGDSSNEQLIFPNKFPSKEKAQEISEMKKENLEKELLKYIRISEQELRQLFIEKFKEKHADLYYSIETPTEAKYKFSEANKKTIKEIKVNDKGQSALLDMCVFKKENYNRILNIEFKYGNAPLEAIAKDVLKLIHEEQNGAFIFLLKNTRADTLCNSGNTGVLDKLSKSFGEFGKHWKCESKYIQLIILSLEQKSNEEGIPSLIHRTLRKTDLKSLDKFFAINSNGYGNITEVSKKWLGNRNK